MRSHGKFRYWACMREHVTRDQKNGVKIEHLCLRNGGFNGKIRIDPAGKPGRLNGMIRYGRKSIGAAQIVDSRRNEDEITPYTGRRADDRRNPHVVHGAKEKKGTWQQIFGNDHPIRIEVGMGKGSVYFGAGVPQPGCEFCGY